MFNIRMDDGGSPRQMLFVFPPREVVKLVLLDLFFFLNGSYPHFPEVSGFLCEPAQGAYSTLRVNM